MLREVIECLHQGEDEADNEDGNERDPIALVVEQSGLVPRNRVAHVLQVHNEYEKVEHEEHSQDHDHIATALNNLVDLLAASKVQAPEDVFLILRQDVSIVFPYPCNLHLLALQRVWCPCYAVVFARATMKHELLLTELREHECALGTC